ncbi:DNA-binding protein, putative [Parvularcula bermudensis HTCC2503]|uniref:DNA-binding protein, putative n=1 Tax=Parvularcula bermudensis (strain ATCC BAA-594 / HTCC2503 / KCTC 12087) TaxID=314260 RepID=E0TE02_PARBH|nr:prolyl-tRNA synthetase associated domain-containing protein [Parvularcula bermudensis]ADM08823.1 DNA-binding protein, putative [Parvularcula bermudensis HTCC2503]
MPPSPQTDPAVQWLTSQAYAVEWVEHAATPRVANALAQGRAPGPGHSKSLLLTDKSGALILVTVPAMVRANLRGLSEALGTGRLSFAAPDTMEQSLGVSPGSLTPLALINDDERRIDRVVLATELISSPTIWCHPLRNTASVGLSPEALIAFVTAFSRQPPLSLPVTT